MDHEDALDFSRAWLADTPPELLRFQATARWLATRQGDVELLPDEPDSDPSGVAPLAAWRLHWWTCPTSRPTKTSTGRL